MVAVSGPLEPADGEALLGEADGEAPPAHAAKRMAVAASRPRLRGRMAIMGSLRVVGWLDAQAAAASAA
jgi:hypothetical protein